MTNSIQENHPTSSLKKMEDNFFEIANLESTFRAGVASRVFNISLSDFKRESVILKTVKKPVN